MCLKMYDISAHAHPDGKKIKLTRGIRATY